MTSHEPIAPARLMGWIVALLGLTLVWGFSVPAIKLALAEFPPLTLTALRYLFALPIFAVLLIGHPIPAPRDLARLAGLGVLGVCVGQAGQNFGVRASAASVAAVLSATIPMFVVIGAAWRLHQPMRARQVLGLVIALAGVGVVGMDDPSSGENSLLGNALMLVSSVATAAYYVGGSDLSRRHGVLVVAGWTSLFGVLPLVPLALWEWRDAPGNPGWIGWSVVIYLAALVTVAGLWLWLRALHALPARIPAASQYLQPLVGVLASALLLGETIGAGFSMGAALVLAGIALTAMPARRRG
jgi:O-acetylserine/cysteine efflux transporter